MRAKQAVLAILLLAPLPALAEQAPHTIYVNGVGQVTAHPDLATLDIGVVSRAASAREALRDDARKMDAVVAAIRALVPSADDIRTSEFAIAGTHPQGGNGQPDYSVIDGYEVTNKVTITVRDLAKVAQVIDAAVDAGANASNSVNFGVKDYDHYADLAQAEAVRAARHHAEVMAGAEHATVGAMIAITNVASGYSGGAVYSSSPVTAVTGTPILPGTITISATAYVTFALK